MKISNNRVAYDWIIIIIRNSLSASTVLPKPPIFPSPPPTHSKQGKVASLVCGGQQHLHLPRPQSPT